jgi:hypothetical protein
MIGQLFAGVGLGLLVGMLVGLSSSPVVSVVVGALAAGIITLLGFVPSAKSSEPGSVEGSVVRLGSFGIVCTAAILAGLFIRTHNSFSPSIAQQVDEVRKAGYSDEESRKWVAAKNLSPLAGADSEKSRPAGAGAPVTASVLFSGGNSGECQHFDTNRYKNIQEQLNALRQLGGNYGEYAEMVSKLDPSHQKTVLDSSKLLFCPK